MEYATDRRIRPLLPYAHRGKPAIPYAVLVIRIRISRSRGRKHPVVGLPAPLESLPRLRGGQKRRIRARTRLQFPGTFTRIRERNRSHRAGNTAPRWAKDAVVNQDKPLPLRVRNSESRLPVNGEGERICGKGRIQADFDKLPLLVGHVHRVRKELDKVGTRGHRSREPRQ